MHTIIAGSRTVTDYQILLDALAHVRWEITTVISGADRLGERYARENNLALEQYPADWKRHGKRAGYLRNVEMTDSARGCVVLWDGKSKGAKMMIEIAQRCKLRLLVFQLSSQGWYSAWLRMPGPQFRQLEMFK